MNHEQSQMKILKVLSQVDTQRHPGNGEQFLLSFWGQTFVISDGRGQPKGRMIQ